VCFGTTEGDFTWLYFARGMNLNSAGVCIFENFQRLNIARGAAERNIQPLEIFKNTHPLPNDRKTWFAGRLVQWILLSRTKFFIACMIHFRRCIAPYSKDCSLASNLQHCSHVGPHLGTQVPMGTFFSFWVPIFTSLGLRTH
jgi:hypothetical protein